MESLKGRPFFCSWSGGKDSCLALYHVIQNGGVPKFLFTMMATEREKSRSHGLSRELLQEQARQMGIPIIFRAASWDDYEKTFIETLREFKADGIDLGVFGDIDVESNRQWVQRFVWRQALCRFIRCGNGLVENCWMNSWAWDSRRRSLY